MPRGLEISDFILTFLKGGDKNTREVIVAYAHYTKKQVADITNNVGNALTRLKDKEKVTAMAVEGVRGSVWSLI